MVAVGIGFDEVLKRLSANILVDGVIVMGSAGKGTITNSSDFDVCIVLAKENPIWLVFTEVENRPSEFYFITTRFIDDHLKKGEIEVKTGTMEAEYLHRILSGKPVFDRTGKINQLKEKLSKNYNLQWKSQAYLYSRWFSINYSLKETKRLLLSDDPIVQKTSSMRTFLYGLPMVYQKFGRVTSRFVKFPGGR